MACLASGFVKSPSRLVSSPSRLVSSRLVSSRPSCPLSLLPQESNRRPQSSGEVRQRAVQFVETHSYTTNYLTSGSASCTGIHMQVPPRPARPHLPSSRCHSHHGSTQWERGQPGRLADIVTTSGRKTPAGTAPRGQQPHVFASKAHVFAAVPRGQHAASSWPLTLSRSTALCNPRLGRPSPAPRRGWSLHTAPMAIRARDITTLSHGLSHGAASRGPAPSGRA